MTYYISGPMSGIADLNRPSFMAAADHLYSRGHAAMLPEWHEPTYRRALTIDLQNICRHADAIYMLTGWEHSPGARAEHAVAVALNLPIAYEGSV